MKAKPLFPNQTVTQTGLPPSQDLIEIVQRIVADILEGETTDAGLTADIAAIEADLLTRVSVQFLSSDAVNSTTTYALTGLGFPVTAGRRYWFRGDMDYDAALATTGAKFSTVGPAAPTRLSYMSDYPSGAATRALNQNLTAYGFPIAATADSGATTGNHAVVEGFITPSADGSFSLIFASEVAASAITVKAGSVIRWAEA